MTETIIQLLAAHHQRVADELRGLLTMRPVDPVPAAAKPLARRDIVALKPTVEAAIRRAPNGARRDDLAAELSLHPDHVATVCRSLKRDGRVRNNGIAGPGGRWFGAP